MFQEQNAGQINKIHYVHMVNVDKVHVFVYAPSNFS